MKSITLSTNVVRMFCCSIIIAALSIQPLLADDIFWDNSLGGDFNTPTNWFPVKVPDSTDAAIFDLYASYPVDFSASATNTNCVIREGEVLMTTNSSTYTLTEEFVVGDGFGSVAYLEIEGANSVNAQRMYIGHWNGSSGACNLLGTSVTVNDILSVGNDGDGYLGMYGSQLSALYCQVGNHDFGGNKGTLELCEMSTLTIQESLRVACDVNSSGEMIIDMGSSVITTDPSGWIVIADKPGSTGSISLTNGSILDAQSAPIVVGASGNGTLSLYEECYAHSSGELFIAGEGSTSSVTIGFCSEYISDSVYSSYVGEKGNGTMTIEDYGRFEANCINIGYAASAVGLVEIQGQGSMFKANSELVVGAQGTGTLNLGDGNATIGDYLYLGHESDGTMYMGNNGRLRGNGTIIGDVVNFEGAVEPGAPVDSLPGTLTIDGDYQQEFDAWLQIKIAGTGIGEYDSLNVLGDAVINDAAFQVFLVDNFIPQLHDTFDVLDADSIIGSFYSYFLPELPGNLDWDTSSLNVDGTITVIPEPATLTLLTLTTLAAINRRRRRKA